MNFSTFVIHASNGYANKNYCPQKVRCYLRAVKYMTVFILNNYTVQNNYLGWLR